MSESVDGSMSSRSTTNTFSGIHPENIYAFIAAQFAGAFVATVLVRWLWRPSNG
jgi:glycerol uptake facilitator-like aquaporin